MLQLIPFPCLCFVQNWVVISFFFNILLTVQHLEAILDNNQRIALFLNVFISCLYMFRATSAHHQQGQLVSVHHLV